MRRSRRSMDARSVLDELGQLHRSLQPGDSFPSHRELLQNMDASERAVRWALDELVRQGKIIRRVGRGGTYVAEGEDVTQLNGNVDRDVEITAPVVQKSRTIVAIAKPDRAVFDHAIHLLFGCAESKDLFLQCQLIDPSSSDLGDLPPATVEPLGYIVFRQDLLPIAKQLQAQGHKVVMVGAPLSGVSFGLPNVYGNHEQGGYRATKHLLELGHCRIAFCGDALSLTSPRWKGYLRAINEANRNGEMSDKYGQGVSIIMEDLMSKTPEALKEFFSGTDAPTGLLIWNDAMALELLSFLTFSGIRVPHDVSIVGYDNLPQSEKVFPALTTMDTNLEQQLEAALEVLTDTHSSSTPVNIITLPTLIRRDSSAAPRSD